MPRATPEAGPEPEADCRRCPRLAGFRDRNRDAFADFFNDPVPSFGGLDARLLVVGLAPGLKGANRTGRPFTGDYAGDLLYPTLIRFGFADGTYGARPDDGLRLVDCRITNAVRCLPPQNKPVGAEVANCRDFLKAEIFANPALRCLLALGRTAHESLLSALAARRADHPFAHNARHQLPGGLILYDSYHCSRYNTNTGRLTTAMFEAVFKNLQRELAGPRR